MKSTLVALSLSLAALSSLEAALPPNKSSKEPPPYDANLFNQDKQVYSGHVEFLFWRVEEAALDYALKMDNPAWSTVSTSFAQGTYQTANFDGDPGFRLKMSYFRAPHYWELWWQYTRLTASGKDQVGKPQNATEFLNGTFPQIMANSLAGAQSEIHLNYNVADFMADRYFNPNPHLRLRVLGGATAVWMNQNWRVHYNDSAAAFTTIRNRWKYIGGGLRIGTMIDWFMGYDIYLTGLGTTAITIGTYQNRSKQTTNAQLTNGSDNINVPIRNAHYSDVRPAFTMQALLGPSWQKNFTNTRVEVFAGYEINAWFNIQEVYRSTAALPSAAKETWVNNGAIALQGLTTRLTVDF